jgi:hypothetical protein
VNASSGDDLDGTTGHGGLVALALLDTGRDENGGGNVTSVATTLTALSADDINTQVEALLDVLDVADHVHVVDAALVEPVNNGLWWHADSRDEELGSGLDDGINELVELTLCVIVAGTLLATLSF